MSTSHPTTEERIDPIEAIADQIASETMAGLDGLLPPEDYAALEELIAVSLAHQPELRRMVRRLVADPVVAASGDVPTRAPGDETERDTRSHRK